MLKHAVIAALSCSIAPCAVAGELTIAQLAPDDALIVFGVDNMGQAKASFERTGMMKIWEDPSVQEWFKEMSSEFMDDVTETLEEVGFEKDDIKAPTGAMGLSMWFSMPDGDEYAEPIPHVVAFADYGDEAAAMHELVVELVEKGEEEESFTLTQDDYRGVAIFNIEGEEQEPEYEWEDPSPPMKMSYAAHGGYLFTTTEPELMHHALDTAMGDETDTIEEDASYRAAMSMIGDTNIHGVVLIEPLIELFSSGMGADPAMMETMLDLLGVSEIRSFSMGAALDTASGVAEMKYAVRVPEKNGIVALFDQPAGSFSPPAFVDADTATFSTFKFDFAGIPPLIQRLMQEVPDMQGAGMFLPMVQPILENLGPDIHITQAYTRPFSPTSQQQLFVIEAKDADVLAQAITSNGAMMGLQSRDFMGNQIWSAAGGMGMDMALGLGFGHLFIGSTPNVENAMRLASNPGENALANTKAFKRAAATTGRGIGFSYSDIRQTMEWADWYLSNMEQIQAEMINNAFAGIPEDEIDEEWREQLLEDAKNEIPAWMRNAPQIGDLVLEVMGDTITEYRSTPEGFVGTMVTLRPAGD